MPAGVVRVLTRRGVGNGACAATLTQKPGLASLTARPLVEGEPLNAPILLCSAQMRMTGGTMVGLGAAAYLYTLDRWAGDRKRYVRAWSINLASSFFCFSLLPYYPGRRPRGLRYLAFLFFGVPEPGCTFLLSYRTRLPGTKLGLVS